MTSATDELSNFGPSDMKDQSGKSSSTVVMNVVYQRCDQGKVVMVLLYDASFLFLFQYLELRFSPGVRSLGCLLFMLQYVSTFCVMKLFDNGQWERIWALGGQFIIGTYRGLGSKNFCYDPNPDYSRDF